MANFWWLRLHPSPSQLQKIFGCRWFPEPSGLCGSYLALPGIRLGTCGTGPQPGQEQAGSARSRCGKCNYVSKKHWRRPDLKILYIVSLVIKVVYTVYTCIIQNIYDSKCFMVQTLLSSLEVMSMEHLLNDITGCDGYQNSIHVVKPLPFMASH